MKLCEMETTTPSNQGIKGGQDVLGLEMETTIPSSQEVKKNRKLWGYEVT